MNERELSQINNNLEMQIGFQILQHHQLMDAQRDILRAQYETTAVTAAVHDQLVQLNFMAYLSTPNGQAYQQWEARALQAAAVADTYEHWWQQAWDANGFQAPLTRRRAARRARSFWWWFWSWLGLEVVMQVLWSVRPVTRFAPIWWPILLGSFVSAIVAYWLARLGRHIRIHVDNRSWKRLIRDRDMARLQRWSIHVFTEGHDEYGRPWLERREGWWQPPQSGASRDSVEEYRLWARTHHPAPSELPWQLTVLGQPRESRAHWPEEVRTVLALMVPGDPETAESEFNERIRNIEGGPA